MKDLSDYEVMNFVRNDANDDEYMLWEVVSSVEQRFRLERPEAVRLTYRAISTLLADGVGELSFGNWETDTAPVSPESLPPPDDAVQWGQPPPERRFWFYSNTQQVVSRVVASIADVIARCRVGDIEYTSIVDRIDERIESLTDICSVEWLEQWRSHWSRLAVIRASMIDEGRRHLSPDELEVSAEALAALDEMTRE